MRFEWLDGVQASRQRIGRSRGGATQLARELVKIAFLQVKSIGILCCSHIQHNQIVSSNSACFDQCPALRAVTSPSKMLSSTSRALRRLSQNTSNKMCRRVLSTESETAAGKSSGRSRFTGVCMNSCVRNTRSFVRNATSRFCSLCLGLALHWQRCRALVSWHISIINAMSERNNVSSLRSMAEQPAVHLQ